MVGLEYTIALVMSTRSRFKKFDWSKLVPRGRMDKYPYGVVALGMTWPWQQTGLGIGVGLGKFDLWFGWPRSEENLHYQGCVHEED